MYAFATATSLQQRVIASVVNWWLDGDPVTVVVSLHVRENIRTRLYVCIYLSIYMYIS